MHHVQFQFPQSVISCFPVITAKCEGLKYKQATRSSSPGGGGVGKGLLFPAPPFLTRAVYPPLTNTVWRIHCVRGSLYEQFWLLSPANFYACSMWYFHTRDVRYVHLYHAMIFRLSVLCLLYCPSSSRRFAIYVNNIKDVLMYRRWWILFCAHNRQHFRPKCDMFALCMNVLMLQRTSYVSVWVYIYNQYDA